MKIACSLALFALGIAAVGDAQPQRTVRRAPPAAPVAPSPNCPVLATSYEQFSKRMASNVADGIADNSAARASMREGQNTNALAQARFTIDLMKEGHCPLPTYMPSASRYLTSALKCRTDTAYAHIAEMRGGEYKIPVSCNQATWAPEAE